MAVIIIVLVFAALVGVAYYLMTPRSQTGTSLAGNPSTITDTAPTPDQMGNLKNPVPTVTKSPDLTTAQNDLNNTNIDGSIDAGLSQNSADAANF